LINFINMKKIILLFCAVIFLLPLNTEAKKLKAYLSYYTFNTPEQEPYLETHISVLGNTVANIKLKNNKFQGSIGITMVIKQAEKIISAEKYNLLSPEYTDTINISNNYIDQKRYKLPNGKYTFELTIVDNGNSNNAEVVKQDFEIKFEKDKIAVSDIILIDSYSKASANTQFNRNGFELIPFVNNFIPTNISKLTFYTEIYNTQISSPNESFLLNYYLQNASGTTKLSNYVQSKKVLSKDVIVLLSEFDVSILPSGSYYVVVELRNRNNEIIASKSNFFQRSNKSISGDLSAISGIAFDNSFAAKYSREEMIENIKCLAPISNQQEMDYTKTLLANNDEVLMRQYLIYFWEKRHPGESAIKWAEYEEQVKIVNEKFGSPFTKGYATDRGIIFLKYGAPNNIRFNDMDNQAYPYEIWQYFKIKTFSNRKFVFFSPDNIRNEMILLHSNLNGERYDPQWKYKIMARTMKYDEDNNDADYYGKRLDADFNE
jgi:GWxTD domain-containing protein